MFEHPHFGTLVQYEDIFAAGAGRAFHGGHEVHHHGFVAVQQPRALEVGVKSAGQTERERSQPSVKARFAQSQRIGKQPQDNGGEGRAEEYQPQHGPRVGAEGQAEVAQPGLEKKFGHGVDLVHDTGVGHGEVVLRVFVGGIEQQGAVVVEDGFPHTTLFEPAVAEVVVEFAAVYAAGEQGVVEFHGLAVAAVAVSGVGLRPQGVGRNIVQTGYGGQGGDRHGAGIGSGLRHGVGAGRAGNGGSLCGCRKYEQHHCGEQPQD